MDAKTVELLSAKMQVQAVSVQVVSVQQKARTFSEYLVADAEKRRRPSRSIFNRKRGKEM